jgi:hypothetical protein
MFHRTNDAPPPVPAFAPVTWISPPSDHIATNKAITLFRSENTTAGIDRVVAGSPVFLHRII